jgi:anthranilate phosphoribosyltransferase
VDIKQAIGEVLERRDLSRRDMADVMRIIMTGNATEAQIGGLLVGLRMKGETVDELTAAAEVMRELVEPVTVARSPLLDVCGTGGDGMATFNVSTASAFVAAAAGAAVAKHGNRSVSSRSGSADLLEAAGVNIELEPARIAECIERVGVGFMFAPRHHPAMRYAAGPRRELAIRSLFNLVGPLTSPANVSNMLLGVFSPIWVEPLARVLRQLGCRHVLVVSSESGTDEISLWEETEVAELKDGEITRYRIGPRQFGIASAGPEAVRVDKVADSLEMIKGVLDNQPGPARDIVCLNAGAAIYAADLVDDIAAGVARADALLTDGSARAKLDALIEISQTI